MKRNLMVILILVMLSLMLCLGCGNNDDTDGDVDGDVETTDGDVDEAIDGDLETTDGDVDETVDGDDDETIDGDTETADGDVDETVDGDDETTDGDVDEAVDGDIENADGDAEDTEDVEDAEDTEDEAEIVLEPGENCTNPVVIDAIPYDNASHNISNYVNDIYFNDGESCTGYVCSGWDKVFSYTATSNIDLTVSMLADNFDGAVYMLTNCTDGVQVSSNCTEGSDNHNAASAEWINFSAVAGTTYYFVVDIAEPGYEPGAGNGTFGLSLKENTGSK